MQINIDLLIDGPIDQAQSIIANELAEQNILVDVKILGLIRADIVDVQLTGAEEQLQKAKDFYDIDY